MTGKRLSQFPSEFQLELKNRFEAVKTLSAEENMQEFYNSFQDVVEKVAEKVAGPIKLKKSPYWVTHHTEKLREEWNKAKQARNTSRTVENRKKCRNLNAELNRAYKEDEIKHLEENLNELRQAADQNQHNVVWRVVKELSGKRASNDAVEVKEADGTRIENTQELLSEWQQYLSQLLNNK